MRHDSTTKLRRRYSPATSRRLPAIAAAGLALVGALLITLAACGARSGPPQPTAAAAGVIDAGTSSARPTASAPLPTAGSASGSAPATTATRLPSSPGQSPAPATRPAAPSKTAPIVVPSFADAAKGPVLQSSQPVSLSIPSLGVKSAVLDLGLNPDGTVQVPSLDDPDSKAGWYRNSPAPGSVGPAIILGHIDSKKYGPGVFYELGNLKPGQEIDVTRKDGTVAVFKVDGVRSYPKAQFPTKEVYGNIDHAGLRLITCGGTFDPSKSSYESNIIAFASLVSSHPA